MVYSLYTLGVENFDEIALSPTVKEIQAILCFRIFFEKFENSKWPPFFESRKFFEIWAEYLANVPWGSKISTKSLYLAPLRRYEQFCVFVENSKIQNGRHFSKDENFLKFGRSILQMYPGGRKFRRNRSISHR